MNGFVFEPLPLVNWIDDLRKRTGRGLIEFSGKPFRGVPSMSPFIETIIHVSILLAIRDKSFARNKNC